MPSAVRDVVVLPVDGLNIRYRSLKMARDLTEPDGEAGRGLRAQGFEVDPLIELHVHSPVVILFHG